MPCSVFKARDGSEGQEIFLLLLIEKKKKRKKSPEDLEFEETSFPRTHPATQRHKSQL